METDVIERAYQHPFPTLRIIDETCDDGSEEVASGQEEGVDGHVRATFVREVNICHGNLAERLNRCTEEALQNLRSNPLSIRCSVCRPDGDSLAPSQSQCGGVA